MTAEGAESSAICLRTRKRVRSTTATEHPAWLATKQRPRKPVAFLWPHASAAADDNSSARREIRGAFTRTLYRSARRGRFDSPLAHPIADHAKRDPGSVRAAPHRVVPQEVIAGRQHDAAHAAHDQRRLRT